MARVLVFDTEGEVNHFKLAECNELSDFYENLHCDTFDIANRDVGGKRFDIFVDDIGLFRENPRVSAIRLVGDDIEPMLVGNLVFANHNAQGETTSLSDDDINLIIQSSVAVMRFDGKVEFVVVCDY